MTVNLLERETALALSRIARPVDPYPVASSLGISCRCPSPACGIDHTAEAQRHEWLVDTLVSLPEFREMVLGDVDDDEPNVEAAIRLCVPNHMRVDLHRLFGVSYLDSTGAQQMVVLERLIREYGAEAQS